MANKEDLRKMLDALVDDKTEQAQTTFHSYLADRMKEVLHGEEDSTVSTDTEKQED